MFGGWGFDLMSFIRDGIFGFLATILGKLLGFLMSLVSWLVSMVVQVLPQSPFASLDLQLPTQWAGWINWAFPVGNCLMILTAWASAVAVWIVIRWLLKLFHVM